MPKRKADVAATDATEEVGRASDEVSKSPNLVGGASFSTNKGKIYIRIQWATPDEANVFSRTVYGYADQSAAEADVEFLRYSISIDGAPEWTPSFL